MRDGPPVGDRLTVYPSLMKEPPMRIANLATPLCALALVTGAFAPTQATAQVPNCCVLPDDGSASVSMPPSCPDGYEGSPMVIVDGLPPGTTIQSPARLGSFFNTSEVPGGTLLGTLAQYSGTLDLDLQGTGTLLGFHRVVAIPVQGEMHTAPRTPEDPVQSFDTDMFFMQGQITGDPDFDLLRITGGTGFGMPSPGHTTLTQLPAVPTPDWAVDSFFDITYRIDFVGAPGGSARRDVRFDDRHDPDDDLSVAGAGPAFDLGHDQAPLPVAARSAVRLGRRGASSTGDEPHRLPPSCSHRRRGLGGVTPANAPCIMSPAGREATMGSSKRTAISAALSIAAISTPAGRRRWKIPRCRRRERRAGSRSWTRSASAIPRASSARRSSRSSSLRLVVGGGRDQST